LQQAYTGYFIPASTEAGMFVCLKKTSIITGEVKIMADNAKKPGDQIIKCCRNCKHLLDFPRNNHYNDVDHFCIMTGYFTHGIDKNIEKIKRYSPGGKELPCNFEPSKP